MCQGTLSYHSRWLLGAHIVGQPQYLSALGHALSSPAFVFLSCHMQELAHLVSAVNIHLARKEKCDYVSVLPSNGQQVPSLQPPLHLTHTRSHRPPCATFVRHHQGWFVQTHGQHCLPHSPTHPAAKQARPAPILALPSTPPPPLKPRRFHPLTLPRKHLRMGPSNHSTRHRVSAPPRMAPAHGCMSQRRISGRPLPPQAHPRQVARLGRQPCKLLPLSVLIYTPVPSTHCA